MEAAEATARREEREEQPPTTARSSWGRPTSSKVLSLPAAVEARRVACRLVAAVSWPASYHDNLFPPFRFLASDSLLSRNFLILGLGLFQKLRG